MILNTSNYLDLDGEDDLDEEGDAELAIVEEGEEDDNNEGDEEMEYNEEY